MHFCTEEEGGKKKEGSRRLIRVHVQGARCAEVWQRLCQIQARSASHAWHWRANIMQRLIDGLIPKGIQDIMHLCVGFAASFLPHGLVQPPEQL